MPNPELDSCQRRNYLLLLGEGILFTVGMVFFDASTILPLLMENLTGSAVLVGFVGLAQPLAKGFAPILAGNWIRALTYKKGFLLGAVSIGRLPLWILGLSLILISPHRPVYWAVLLILIELLFWFGDAAGDPAWMDLVGKTIPPDRRGKFFASRQVVGGILSIFAGGLVARILELDTLDFPVNYGLIITIGALIYTLNISTFIGIRETPGPVSDRAKVLKLFKNIPLYFRKSRPFALAMVIQFLGNMSRISLPFYILFGRQFFGLTGTDIGVLISVQIIGRIAGGMLWGIFGDRLGHHRAIQGVALVSILPPLIAVTFLFLSGASTLLLFSILYFCIGMFSEGWSPFINYMLDVVSPKERPLYAGLMGVPQVPVALAPIAGGIIVQNAGYYQAFILTLILTLIGFSLSWLLPSRTSSTTS